MLDQIIRLDTPQGRSLYRLINVLVPQSVIGSLLFMLNQVGDVPVDADIQSMISVFLAGLITAADKYRRDIGESNRRTQEVFGETNERLHGFINTEK